MEKKVVKIKEVKKSKSSIKKEEPKKVSKTWLAFLKAKKNPGEILDMKAVLK